MTTDAPQPTNAPDLGCQRGLREYQLPVGIACCTANLAEMINHNLNDWLLVFHIVWPWDLPLKSTGFDAIIQISTACGHSSGVVPYPGTPRFRKKSRSGLRLTRDNTGYRERAYQVSVRLWTTSDYTHARYLCLKMTVKPTASFQDKDIWPVCSL